MATNISELPFAVAPSSQRWLAQNSFDKIARCESIGGGHHECYVISNDSGQSIVAKVATGDSDILLAEARGLDVIAQTKVVRTPDVLHCDTQCLLIEYIEEAQQSSQYWQLLAQAMVELHRQIPSVEGNLSTPYGLAESNYCGTSPQQNGWFEDGHEFYSEQRLLFQARMAFDNGLLESPWVISIESICERLTELIPWQTSSLLHGDLWPGNILVDQQGHPALIDPAVYYGWREADIAMSLLFGGLPHEFYATYNEIWPMDSQWRSRVPLYNLYHLLNHLNMFGGSYTEQVKEAISRYA